jgi:hypothetical protein
MVVTGPQRNLVCSAHQRKRDKFKSRPTKVNAKPDQEAKPAKWYYYLTERKTNSLKRAMNQQ